MLFEGRWQGGVGGTRRGGGGGDLRGRTETDTGRLVGPITEDMLWCCQEDCLGELGGDEDVPEFGSSL